MKRHRYAISYRVDGGPGTLDRVRGCDEEDATRNLRSLFSPHAEIEILRITRLEH